MGSVHSSPALSNKARTPTGRHHSLSSLAQTNGAQRQPATSWPSSTLRETRTLSSQYNGATVAFLPLRARQAPSAVRLRANFSVAILPAAPADSLGRSSAAFSTRSDNAISLPFLGDRQRNQPSLPWDQKWSPLFWKGEVFGYAWHLSPSPVSSEDWSLLGPHFGRGIVCG